MFAIGSYQLTGNLLLAPMAGVTDLPFRRLCRHFGAAMTTGEMVTSDTRLWNSRKTRTRLPDVTEAEPRSIQIAGTEPEQLAEAARQSVRAGAQIVDINMGCPAKKVCSKAAGSALLKDVELVRRILGTVVAAVDVPVTLKFRTGWCESSRNALTIAQLAEEQGIAALALHGRTRADGYRGKAEYETVRKVKQQVAIPVIANGDISSPDDAEFILNYTQADALMLGRSTWGQPWILRI
ncbi:MAG: tRNA dihydrouridine synthase DusB [Thiolinea sp.]